jgi:asparagine synthase (glutamine-hydrolysing)
MCGIAGIFVLDRESRSAPQRAPTREALSRMCTALTHRGPDEFGVYRDRQVGLAHARLSIIDLSTGQQPLANEDETLWIVFNGEIFNYVELREELVAFGHRFRTKSDTEVIVHAYEQWGEAAFARFNGQWALALWDTREQKLVLSRDRLGVRPLFYAEHAGRLIFGSEIKALFAGEPELPRALDPVGLEQTFTFWTVVPPQTVFQGIRELEPGHVRTYARGDVRDVSYWEPTFPLAGDGEFRGTIEDAAGALEDALDRAVHLRMVRADVPVGSYLSGGLDSSLVTALAKHAKPSGFKTFSLRFDDAEYDETPYQRAMVERLGTEHHEVVVSRKSISAVFPEVIRATERPILRTAPAPLFLLSKLVREQGIKVVLTGEGADEMLAGYDLFREAKVRRFWAKFPRSTMRPRLLERLYPYMARSPVAQRAVSQRFFGRNLENPNDPTFAHDLRFSGTAALKRLFSPDLRRQIASRDVLADLVATFPREFSRWTPLARDQYVEIRTLLGGYLLSSQGDRMLMANSVEGRFPFLDMNVVTLAASFPPAFKLKVLDEKHVLKRVGRSHVTASILARPKQPYRAPDALSFTGPDKPEWAEDMMSERALEDAAVFHVGAARSLWLKCQNREGDSQFSNADNMAIVGILSTQLLHDQLVRAAPEPRPAPKLTTLIER